MSKRVAFLVFSTLTFAALQTGLGATVATLFAVGLLASGLASTAVGAYAGAEIMHGESSAVFEITTPDATLKYWVWIEKGLPLRIEAVVEGVERGARGDARAIPDVDAVGVALEQAPVEPGDLVVLAIRVVVARLRVAELVAREQHRHALRQEQRGEEVAHLARAQRVHAGVVGRALGAAVRAEVVRVTVGAALEEAGTCGHVRPLAAAAVELRRVA